MYSKHSGGCWEQCRRASRGGGGRAVWSPCRPLFVSHGSARVVVRGLLVRLLVWVLLCPSCIAGPSLVHRASVCSSGCSSVPRALCVRLLDSSLLHRWSIAGPSAGPSAGASLIHLFLCHSCIARPSGCCSVPRASLMRRSSACLCTARPSACAPLVRLMVRLLESRSLLHRWVEGYRTSGRRGCSFGVAGDGIVKACSIESNGGSERKTACWRKGKRCWHVQEGLFVTEREWRLMLTLS